MTPKEPVALWKRIAGCFSGAIAGIVLGAILFIILEISGVVAGGDLVFVRFAAWGAGCCALLGAIFPRCIIAAGYYLGQLIPGV